MKKPDQTFADGLYREFIEVKVVRSQYGLAIGMNVTAKAIKEALAKIPDEAIIVDEEENNVNMPPANAVVYIFELEKAEGQEQRKRDE